MMKKAVLILFATVAVSTATYAQKRTEYKVITVVESIIPGGLGRSRLIESKEALDVNALTTERVDGKKSKQGDVSRKEAKVDSFAESKLLNFFSVTGINFQNIASNDAIITSKLNQLAEAGWTLAFVTSGVESYAGNTDNQGLFITRFVFKR